MNTEYTDLELQLWLAKQLQNELRVGPTGIYWKCDWQNVQYTEWLHVVSLVEEKLTDKQWNQYVVNLARVIAGAEKGDKVHVPTNVLISAKYQPRAVALSKTLNIPIRKNTHI